MKWNKVLIILLIVGIIAAFYLLDARRYFNLAFIQQNLSALQALIVRHTAIATASYFLLYAAAVAAFLPVAALLTLLGGALFPLWQGLLLVSFASSLGAVGNALLARYILRDSLERRYQRQLRTINRNLQRNGSSYLFTLRLLPVFPFFVINLVFGLTRMKLWRFYWVSQLGMLPGTAVYVNAGYRLGQIENPGDIFSPRLWLSFALLALLPYLSKLAVASGKALSLRRRFPGAKPRRADANMVVIGAGAGGLIASYIANMLRAKVILIERNKMGGDCLNYGCVPSKSLLAAAKYAHSSQEAAACGVHLAPQVDFAQVMAYVRGRIAAVAPHDSVERYQSLGVEVIQGEAQLHSPWEVEVNARRIRTRSIILATGSRPRVPDYPGLREIRPLTAETVWDLTELPKRLLVLGGGPVGAELSLAFARLGSTVILAERGSQILSREEPKAAEIAAQTLKQSGVTVLLHTEGGQFQRRPKNANGAGEAIAVRLKSQAGKNPEEQDWLEVDQVLVALGRESPDDTWDALGLAQLGIERNERGSIATNEFLQTNIPHIYAVGDATLAQQFTHTAGFSAYFASVNALFGGLKKSAMSLHAVPAITYLQPEIARVGHTEATARQEYGEDVECCDYDLGENDRAIAENQQSGFVRLVLQKSRGRVVGVTIVAPHAGEMLGEWLLVLNRKIKKEAIFASMYAYPSYSEANKAVISEWKKQRMPHKILHSLEVFFRWRR